MNSKAEFNRCTIGRLTLGENKEEEAKLRKLQEQDGDWEQ